MTSPPIIGWGRPNGYSPPVWHAVLSRDDGGSVLTACRGRWSAASAYDFIAGLGHHGCHIEKCGACADATSPPEPASIEECLAELCNAEPVVMRGVVELDLSDVEAELAEREGDR